MIVAVAIAPECEAGDWWDAVLVAAADYGVPMWLATVAVFGDTAMSEEDAKTAQAWCRSLPGWEGGPDHAPHPLTFQPEDWG